MGRIINIINHPTRLLRHLRVKKLNLSNLSILSDEEYLKVLFKAYIGKKLNLENPQTFNEKIQWLKLYDRNPLYTRLVDKYLVRDYISQKIGDDYLIPLIGVWDKPEDIDFSGLPNEFVLKCNHNSGLGMFICRDKEKIDTKRVIANLRVGLNENYYRYGREWPYKDVPKKIICERFISDKKSGCIDSGFEQLTDYKFMCFGGKVKCLFVCVDRFTKSGIKINFYDTEWNKLPFERHYPSTNKTIPKPQKLKQMIEVAECLAEGFPFVRVDLYESEEKIYFGEMTFYPGSGFEEFSPKKWDKKLGDYIDLSRVIRKE